MANEEAQMIWLTWLRGLWSKAAFKFALAIALALVCYFRATAWRDAAVEAERNIWLNAPAVRDTVVEIRTTTLRDTAYLFIQGKTDTVYDVSNLTLNELQAAVQPFSISQAVTVTDDTGKVGISFDMSLTARPLRHSITGLKFYNIRSTYPKETITVTKTVFEPYHAKLLDLFVESKIGGVFGVKGIAGYAQAGVDVNIGFVQLSGGIGAASKDHSLSGLWTVGAKVSTR
jgi:hypothetical protein